MTKKPSEKNKAWEKERRDRLNKAFEQLAKLLPAYDPTVTWSKNEIIQKSIAYIEEMHKKHESIMQEQDPAALKEYKELLDTLKFFKSRNGQLAELLNKAKITIPPAKFPKFLIDNPTFGEEEKGLEITTKPVGRPKKYDNKITATNAEVLAKTVNGKMKSGSEIEKKMPKKTESSTAMTSAAVATSNPLPIGAIISTGVLLPLIPCRPTPFLPTSNPTNATCQPSSTAYRKCKILSIQNLPRINRLPRTKDGKVVIMPRPTIKLHVRRNDGKIAIPVLKRKVIAAKRKRRRRRRVIQPAAERKTKKRKLPVEKDEAITEKQAKPTESEIIDANQNALPLASSELPDDYFATLQIPENNSNPSSVSPTAAFLLSFPVVSTAGGGKNTDGTDETSTMLGDEQQRKGSGVTEGLENLNNFFSTKEYYKYCGDGGAIGKESTAVEAESNLTNSKTMPVSTTIVSEEAGETSVPSLPVTTTWTASPIVRAESCKVSSVTSTPILSTAQSTVLSHQTVSLNSFIPKVSCAVSSSISPQYPHTIPISLPLSSFTAPSVVSAVSLSVLPDKTDHIPTSTTNSCSYSPPNNFPPIQASNFSVSNIFPPRNLPTVDPKELIQPVAAQTHRTKASQQFSQNIPFIPPQSNHFSRPSYQPNQRPSISSNTAKPSSTPLMATSIFNSSQNPGPFSLLMQTTYSAISPSGPATISSSSNSMKTTKSMQFTDYSSTFMTTVATVAPTRSYSTAPKDSVRTLNQNTLGSSSVAPIETSSCGKPLSFPISYNFGPCTEAEVKGYTKSLHSSNSSVPERLPTVSNGKPVVSVLASASNTFATPLVTQSFIDSVPRSNDPICVTTTANYYFPLQTPASVTSTFTFNLTSTVSTAVATTAPTSLAQPFLTYNSVKPAIPWIPVATAAVDYKPSFTFSLTPSSVSFTTSTCQTVNSSGPVKSFATLPAVKPSESIAKTTFDPFHSAKPLNPYSTTTAASNSYTSTNFTFSLAKPKNTVTIATDFTKTLPSCSAVDPKYQTSSYHPYNLENYANVYPKETTNFTFALTKPTQSFSSSFSIDATLGVTSSYSSHTHQTMLQSNDFHKNRTAKPNHYTSNQKPTTKDATATNYYTQEQHKADKVTQKSHVNWMTSSEAMQPMDIGQQPTASYYATHITPALDFNSRKIEPNCTGHAAVDENFTAWSPSKILDTSHLMQSTAPPNYYNDLICAPPITYDNSKPYPKPYGLEKSDKSFKTSASTTNQVGNFFSVSQLVDQTASSSKACEVVGYHKKTPAQKTKDCRKSVSCGGNMYTSDHKPATTLNNYSAEALISKKEKHRNYHPPALHHNSADYYPPPQHATVNQMASQDATENLNYNSNYFYNYMPPNQNFAPEVDYLGAYSGEVQYGKFSNASMVSKSSKSEKRLPPPAPPPNLMTYDSNYLPVPPLGAPPPVVEAYEPHPSYSHNNNFQHGGWNAKSSLPTYHHHHGQGMLHNEPNLASSGGQVASGNLTNFNLSSICPEINDKVGQTNW